MGRPRDAGRPGPGRADAPGLAAGQPVSPQSGPGRDPAARPAPAAGPDRAPPGRPADGRAVAGTHLCTGLDGGARLCLRHDLPRRSVCRPHLCPHRPDFQRADGPSGVAGGRGAARDAGRPAADAAAAGGDAAGDGGRPRPDGLPRRPGRAAGLCPARRDRGAVRPRHRLPVPAVRAGKLRAAHLRPPGSGGRGDDAGHGPGQVRPVPRAPPGPPERLHRGGAVRPVFCFLFGPNAGPAARRLAGAPAGRAAPALQPRLLVFRVLRLARLCRSGFGGPAGLLPPVRVAAAVRAAPAPLRVDRLGPALRRGLVGGGRGRDGAAAHRLAGADAVAVDGAGGGPVRAGRGLARMGGKRGRGDFGRGRLRGAGLGRGGAAAGAGGAVAAHGLPPRFGVLLCHTWGPRRPPPAPGPPGPAPRAQAVGPAPGGSGRGVFDRLRPGRPVPVRAARLQHRGQACGGGPGFRGLGGGSSARPARQTPGLGGRAAVRRARRRPVAAGARRGLAGGPQPCDGLAALVPGRAGAGVALPALAHRRAAALGGVPGRAGSGRSAGGGSGDGAEGDAGGAGGGSPPSPQL